MNKSTQWQLSGNSPKIYDQYIAPAVSAPWYSLFVETGLPYMKGPIADIGCGTGSFLLHLLDQKKISHKTKLVGVDVNALMLAIAEEKSSMYKNSISWVTASVNKLPFNDNYFQLVYCQQGIQYFENKGKALSEIYRIMDLKGVLIATVWSVIEECVGYKCLSDAILRIVGDNARSSLYAPFSYSDPHVLKELARSVGFKMVSVQLVENFVYFSSIKEFGRYRIYGSPLIYDLPPDKVEEIIDKITFELELSLKPYIGKNGLSFPVKANYLIAKK
ncbi:MAG: class I SAM-dependent methyltransferase [Gammaproteobacteria bacterium]|nr:MAG: class I SAM-dependent methyltransferase [Gammaproteobacteria bacterium]